MQPSEVLAVIRLRQWSYDRARLSAVETANYRRQGYRQRRQREADSRLVRVLDFERALAIARGECYGSGQFCGARRMAAVRNAESSKSWPTPRRTRPSPGLLPNCRGIARKLGREQKTAATNRRG